MVVNNLAQTHPDLCKEWNSKRNGNLRPEDVTAGSKKRVWWFLPYSDPKSGKYFEFEWQSRVNNRVNFPTCPFLTHNPKVYIGFNDLATVYPEIAKEWHPSKNGTLKPTDVTSKSNKKVWWYREYKDPKTGKVHEFEWPAQIQSRVKGESDCPFLSGRLIKVGFNDLCTTNPKLAAEWHPTKNGNLKPTDVTANSPKKVWWYLEYKDPKTGKLHEFEWKSTVNNRNRGRDCPYLVGKAIKIGFNDLATVFPEIAAEWHPSKNGTLKPTDVTSVSGKKVWWYLPYTDPITGKHFDFEWKSSISNRVKGRKCPYIENKAIWIGYNDLATTHPMLIDEWDFSKNENIKPTDVLSGSKDKIWWKCELGHSWKANVLHRTLRNQGCPICSASKLEKITYTVLKKYNIMFKKEHKFDDIQVKYFPFDFYIKYYNLLIELDGKQHFELIEYFTMQIKFEERVRRDNLKNKFALENNIPILRIPYIYHPVKDKQKIESLILDFIKTRKVPSEILAYYEQYEFSNYARIANELNSLIM